MIHFPKCWEVVMARFDLTDFEWAVIQPLLPTMVCGVKRAEDRRVLDGIFWRHAPERPWRTFRRVMAPTRPA